MKAVISQQKFNLIKPYINGICFWREKESNIEVKIPKCFLKYYDTNLLNFLKSNHETI